MCLKQAHNPRHPRTAVRTHNAWCAVLLNNSELRYLLLHTVICIGCSTGRSDVLQLDMGDCSVCPRLCGIGMFLPFWMQDCDWQLCFFTGAMLLVCLNLSRRVCCQYLFQGRVCDNAVLRYPCLYLQYQGAVLLCVVPYVVPCAARQACRKYPLLDLRL